MKTLSKKLLSLLLVAVMLVAALPFAAFATEATSTTYTVVVKLGADKATATEVARGELTTADAVNPETADGAAAILAAATLNPTFDKTGKNFEAGSVKGTTIYIRYSEATPAHNHDFSGTPVKKDDNSHTYTCTVAGCDETKDEAHTWTFVNSDSDGNHTLKCNACGATKTEAHTYGSDGVCTVAGCGAKKPAEPAKTTYKVVFNDSTGTSTKTYQGNVETTNIDAMTNAQLLAAIGVSKDISSSDVVVTRSTDTTNKVVTITAAKKADNKYNVQLWVNNQKSSYVENVTYNQSIVSSKEGAMSILSAANITLSDADKYTAWRVTSNGNTINVYAAQVLTVTIHRNNREQDDVIIYPEVGKPYKDYLTTEMMDNVTVEGIRIMQANSNVYGNLIPLSNITNGSTVVGVNDREIKISYNGDPCTITFYKADNKTVLTTMSFYAGQPLTNLPVYTVDGKTATWTYMGQPLRSNYTYSDTNIKVYPDFNSIRTVWLNIYVNGNVKTMSTQIELTARVQNDTVTLSNEIKGLIADKLGNSKNTKLTYTGFFNADEWYNYAKNKNTSGTNPYDVANRQGRLDLYIMVNNVNVKTADSSNPKTGDTAKLGVAAAVLAVAVVGFGAVTVVNKKKGVQ